MSTDEMHLNNFDSFKRESKIDSLEKNILIQDIILVLSVIILLLPVKDIRILTIFTIIYLCLIFIFISKIPRFIIVAFSIVIFFIFTFNFLFGDMGLYALKPFGGIAAVSAIILINKHLCLNFYKRFLVISFVIMAVFFIFHFLDIKNINNFFRITDQLDPVHLSRVTAPFLYAGDFGLAALFLAMLSFSINKKEYFILGVGFIILLIFSQSRLALAGISFIPFLNVNVRMRIILLSISMALLGAPFLFPELVRSNFPYIYRIIEDAYFYAFESKRAEEIIFIFNNWSDIFFSGTNNFSTTGGLTTAESSIVSYAVKAGLIGTVIFWVVTAIIFIKSLKNGIILFFLVGFLSLLSAPLDRPKLAIVVSISIAGIAAFSSYSSKLKRF